MNSHKLHQPPSWLAAGLVLAASLALPAQAQTIYREVGPDGRVVFSDRPLNQASKASAGVGAAADAGSGASALTNGLSFALRSAAGKYPVTLYTGDDCAPCADARQLLDTRGVPYLEKTVQTEADVAALQKLSGQASLPMASIGSKRLSGYTQSEWSQYLTAAGYPEQSQLPPGYRRPAASPLAPAPKAEQPAESVRQQTRPAEPATLPAAPAVPVPGNPAGIVF